MADSASLERMCTARYRGFESHPLRHTSLLQSFVWQVIFNLFFKNIGNKKLAPVAQMDRVLASEAKGRAFDSRQAH